MQVLIAILAFLLAIAHFFRWLIVIVATLMGMVAGGFFAGLGVGFFVWIILKLSYFMVFVVIGYKILSDPLEEETRR